jgi:site-specific DNA-methyltransferase (adenine-specific)
MNIDLRLGDCIEVMKSLPDNSVDSVITDPPYGIGFMNKEWDDPKKHKELIDRETKRAQERFEEGKSPVKGGFSKGVQPGLAIGGAKEGRWFQEWCELWAAECYRVLKPGGYILSFSAPRTYHRMATAFEEVGFQVRDQISWIFGSGFPKSHNIGKAIDKMGIDSEEYKSLGTALKPAHEPICMARKPLSEKSIAENVLKWGTGGINIDGSRIPFDMTDTNPATNPLYRQENEYKMPEPGQESNGAVNFTSSKNEISKEGRFPANLIIECICDDSYTKPAPASGHWSKTTTTGFGEFGNGSSTYEGVGEKESGNMVIHTNPECPCYMLDQQSGVKKSQKRSSKHNKDTEHTNTYTPKASDYREDNTYADKGGASRFFYSPKVSKKERDMNMNSDYKEQTSIGSTYSGNQTTSKLGGNPDKPTEPKKNNHPTVKPKELMKYLIKLVSPPNAVILEPFLGSGSTGIAAKELGFISTFIGIEKEQEYMDIAKQRIGE